MPSSTPNRTATIGLWVLKGLLALAFLAFGAMKLIGQPMMVEHFGVIGLGQGFRYVTGLIEVTSAVALLIPIASRFAAAAMLCVSIGACIAQITRLHGDVIHTLVLIALTGFVTWVAWKPSTRSVALA